MPGCQLPHLGKQKMRPPEGPFWGGPSEQWAWVFTVRFCLALVQKHTISFPLNQTQGQGPYYVLLPLTSISLTCDWLPGSPTCLPDMCPDHVVPISSSAYSSHLGTIQNLLYPSGLLPSFKRPSPNTVAHVADSLLWLHFDIRGWATQSGSCLLSLCHFLIDQKVCLPLNFPSSLKVEAVTSSWVCDV